jgi:hypothetical protein
MVGVAHCSCVYETVGLDVGLVGCQDVGMTLATH